MEKSEVLKAIEKAAEYLQATPMPIIYTDRMDFIKNNLVGKKDKIPRLAVLHEVKTEAEKLKAECHLIMSCAGHGRYKRNNVILYIDGVFKYNKTYYPEGFNNG